MAIQLNAKIRTVAGKGAARSVRNNKNIPAVIYGMAKAPISIELDGREFGMLIQKPGLRTKLFEISVDGAKENSMLVDIQYHPVSDNVVHADFKRIDVKKPVNVVVPVETINADISRGLKMGGSLNVANRRVSIVGLVENIPEKIIIDLKDMNIGDSVHGAALNLPAGVELGLRQAELAFIVIDGKIVDESAAKPEETKPAKGKKK